MSATNTTVRVPAPHVPLTVGEHVTPAWYRSFYIPVNLSITIANQNINDLTAVAEGITDASARAADTAIKVQDLQAGDAPSALGRIADAVVKVQDIQVGDAPGALGRIADAQVQVRDLWALSVGQVSDAELYRKFDELSAHVQGFAINLPAGLNDPNDVNITGGTATLATASIGLGTYKIATLSTATGSIWLCSTFTAITATLSTATGSTWLCSTFTAGTATITTGTATFAVSSADAFTAGTANITTGTATFAVSSIGSITAGTANITTGTATFANLTGSAGNLTGMTKIATSTASIGVLDLTGSYIAGTLAATGYTTVLIGTTTYKMLVST